MLGTKMKDFLNMTKHEEWEFSRIKETIILEITIMNPF